MRSIFEEIEKASKPRKKKKKKEKVPEIQENLKDQELAGQVPNKEEIPITEVTKEEPAIQPNQTSDQKSEKLETPEKMDVSDSPETQETIQNSTIESNNSNSSQF